MLTGSRILRMYDRGHITEAEKFFLLMQITSEQNVTQFIAWMSPELLREVKLYIDGCPRTEEAWSRMRIFRMGGYVNVSAGQMQADQGEELRLHRQGVEILRDCIDPYWPRRGTIPSSLLAWNSGTLVKLAQAIRKNRHFQDMPILGDALQDAGCNDEDILRHCRQPEQPHTRGCWLLSAILDRT